MKLKQWSPRFDRFPQAGVDKVRADSSQLDEFLALVIQLLAQGIHETQNGTFRCTVTINERLNNPARSWWRNKSWSYLPIICERGHSRPTAHGRHRNDVPLLFFDHHWKKGFDRLQRNKCRNQTALQMDAYRLLTIKWAIIFTLKTDSISWIVSLDSCLKFPIPALLIRISTVPYTFRISLLACSTESNFVTLHSIVKISPPISWTSDFNFAKLTWK